LTICFTTCIAAKKKKKCYTALKRLRRNEPLARERVQQGRTRGCHQPHFKKLERDERAEANNCPSATEVTWQAMKPVNRKRKKKKKKKKKKCYTALTRLRRNEPLARERVQQGRTRGCHQPHFKRLERNERAEADHCPSATKVT
jgi:hypothetical protein